MGNRSSASVSKRDLWKYVNGKLQRTVHYYHVFAIISILFEEIVKDLKQGKDIKIAHLGTISLQSTKPRWYHNVRLRQKILSPGYRIMRFTLTPVLHKKLIKLLDLDKTFKDD